MAASVLCGNATVLPRASLRMGAVEQPQQELLAVQEAVSVAVQPQPGRKGLLAQQHLGHETARTGRCQFHDAAADHPDPVRPFAHVERVLAGVQCAHLDEPAGTARSWMPSGAGRPRPTQRATQAAYRS